MPTSIISSSLALSAFAIAIVSGLTAGNPAHITLGRAVLVMFACWLLGWCLGAMTDVAVRDDVRRRTRSIPAGSGPDVAQDIHSPATDNPSRRERAL